MSIESEPGAAPAAAALSSQKSESGAHAPAFHADDVTRELNELVDYLQTSVEADRSSLAKELHDELGGLITAAKMDMAWLNAQIGSTLDAASAEKFRSVVQMLSQAMTLKRRVVEELRPSLLDHFGLAVALRSHFDEKCAGAGIECISTLPDDALDLQSSVQLAMFRVAQEALSSVLKRGSAKHVELVIEADESGYSMSVGEDGVAQDKALSRALNAMRHRIKSVGGTFESEVAPEGAGSRIRIFVPRGVKPG